MNIIQKTGITLLLIASAILIALLFINKYKITEADLKKAVTNQKEQKDIQKALQPMMGKIYGSNFNFISDIETNLQSANQSIKNKYEITSSDIDQIVSRFDGEEVIYQNEKIDDVFDDGKVGDFKKEQLKSYTSWMNGNSYTSETLKNHLENTRSNINSNI
ncbi:MAG: 4Fe-4S ferredoxin, partial [Fulvivirga sp.]|nr:4Fe-4S ferredoxin [Fulvivirga sp.]